MDSPNSLPYVSYVIERGMAVFAAIPFGGEKMEDLFRRVEELKSQALKTSNEQFEAIISNVQTPALKKVLKKIKKEKGVKNPTEMLRYLADDQLRSIEKAANSWAKKINKVRYQGQRKFESEVAQVLRSSILDGAEDVKKSIKSNQKRVVGGVEQVARFAIGEVDRVTAPLKKKRKKKKLAKKKTAKKTTRKKAARKTAKKSATKKRTTKKAASKKKKSTKKKA